MPRYVNYYPPNGTSLKPQINSGALKTSVLVSCFEGIPCAAAFGEFRTPDCLPNVNDTQRHAAYQRLWNVIERLLKEEEIENCGAEFDLMFRYNFSDVTIWEFAKDRFSRAFNTGLPNVELSELRCKKETLLQGMWPLWAPDYKLKTLARKMLECWENRNTIDLKASQMPRVLKSKDNFYQAVCPSIPADFCGCYRETIKDIATQAGGGWNEITKGAASRTASSVPHVMVLSQKLPTKKSTLHRKTINDTSPEVIGTKILNLDLPNPRASTSSRTTKNGKRTPEGTKSGALNPNLPTNLGQNKTLMLQGVNFKNEVWSMGTYSRKELSNYSSVPTNLNHSSFTETDLESCQREFGTLHAWITVLECVKNLETVPEGSFLLTLQCGKFYVEFKVSDHKVLFMNAVRPGKHVIVVDCLKCPLKYFGDKFEGDNIQKDAVRDTIINIARQVESKKLSIVVYSEETRQTKELYRGADDLAMLQDVPTNLVMFALVTPQKLTKSFLL
eukprot:Gregarina_sp_Poly_1__3643@NODE_2073_length_2733_cov_25_124156_g1337_i0_p1_GENE_NODE_2073_length_2733_cov_25_124156_g1337_i0NODE_2073_length_2733_cov_25_124156_g1337_i0_p1_ORF_typecomplete_len502_score60_31_NODE_2073_length_2733_cov_25_124156_g1337_i09832488